MKNRDRGGGSLRQLPAHLRWGEVVPRAMSGRCEVCAQKTKDVKPFCPRHLASMPYVIRLVSDLSAREQDIENLQSSHMQAASTKSRICADIVNHLKFSLLEGRPPLSVERIGIDLVMDAEAVLACVIALAQEARVKLEKIRECLVVSLPDDAVIRSSLTAGFQIKLRPE